MANEAFKKVDDQNLNAVAGGRQSDLSVAYDVLEGKYGDGEERIRRLRAAGYNPRTIQNIVNQLVKGTYRDPYKDPIDPPPYVDPYK
ncbi:MAG: hypothetical protein K6F56_07135 [Oscillospiraceae bacterium]|nr:hypothetical protein [Oscillospiraceae bacterium]